MQEVNLESLPPTFQVLQQKPMENKKKSPHSPKLHSVATENPCLEDDSCPFKIDYSQVAAVNLSFFSYHTCNGLVTTRLFPKKCISVDLHNAFVVVDFFLQTSSGLKGKQPNFKFQNYSPKNGGCLKGDESQVKNGDESSHGIESLRKITN